MAAKRFDVLVIGGGLVGASLGCALAGTGRRVGLVEAAPFSGAGQPSFDERTTAMAWGSRRLFEAWGLWAAIAPEAAPITRLHVSQRGHLGATRVAAADYGVEALGYVVPNRVLGRALLERLAALDDVTMLAPVRFESLRSSANSVEVRLRDEHDEPLAVTTRLLVGADGVGSRVRQALAIPATVDDYGQSAVVTTLRASRAHGHTAYERFTPDGPIAALPTQDARGCALVWTLPTAEAERRLAQTAEDFLGDLQGCFGHRLGVFSDLGARAAYPLRRLLCPRPAAPRAVLVGNAGHNLHPAAAQGFNLALRDVAVLAEQIGAAQDPGSEAVIDAWCQSRRADQRRVSDFTDFIVRLFSNRVPGLDSARSMGLIGLELFPEVKHAMARRSMGLAVVASDG